MDEFDFDTKYLPREHNKVADYLSRLESKAQLLCVATAEDEQTANWVAGIRMQDIRLATHEDTLLENVSIAVNTKVWDEDNL